ncbi:MAG: bifunctional 5,10-methylenetetrahydrofolate dehydrogenase/5,10-methenyltetrahydrofolate cyclohydrolase [Patescibacteria group bacterium]
MPATILSGRTVRDALVPELIKKIEALSFVPTLAIIQVGTREDSTAFINAKRRFAAKIGVQEKHIQLPETISEAELISKIQECNDDASIHALIVQLPLPPHMNRDKVIAHIDPAKDADGLTTGAKVMPATARGIRELLAFYHVPISGKKVAVIGRSLLVGTPVAEMCRQAGAQVTVCHRGTPDLVKETQAADVIIVAAGSAGLIRKDHVREGQIVIDVGINTSSEGKMVGDVSREVADVVAMITPVPGGVGPMTVCALFENVLDLCK